MPFASMVMELRPRSQTETGDSRIFVRVVIRLLLKLHMEICARFRLTRATAREKLLADSEYC